MYVSGYPYWLGFSGDLKYRISLSRLWELSAPYFAAENDNLTGLRFYADNICNNATHDN